jgi:hypothetical protein
MADKYIWERDFRIVDLRWQLLSRNKQYCAAYKRFSEKHPGFPGKIDQMTPKQLDNALKDIDSFKIKWGCAPGKPSVHTNPCVEVQIDPEAILPTYVKKSQSLRFDIPIDMPSEAIIRWVRYWVGHYKRREGKGLALTKTRLEDITLAIKVYDLKIEGGKYREISEILELDPDYQGTGIDRAKNLYNTAKTWIKRAEMKSLWMDAPWIFDTIIDTHKAMQGNNSQKDSG